jgi:hypothetical protein
LDRGKAQITPQAAGSEAVAQEEEQRDVESCRCLSSRTKPKSTRASLAVPDNIIRKLGGIATATDTDRMGSVHVERRQPGKHWNTVTWSTKNTTRQCNTQGVFVSRLTGRPTPQKNQRCEATIHVPCHRTSQHPNWVPDRETKTNSWAKIWTGRHTEEINIYCIDLASWKKTAITTTSHSRCTFLNVSPQPIIVSGAKLANPI